MFSGTSRGLRIPRGLLLFGRRYESGDRSLYRELARIYLNELSVAYRLLSSQS